MTAIASVDRTGMAGSPAALAVNDDNSTTYTFMRGGLVLPLRLSIVDYAGTSKWLSGRTATSSRVEHSTLGLGVRVTAATDTALRTAVDALEAAVNQFQFTVTTTVGTAAAQVWSCDAGSMIPADESVDVMDVLRHRAAFRITIPCRPTPGA